MPRRPFDEAADAARFDRVSVLPRMVTLLRPAGTLSTVNS